MIKTDVTESGKLYFVTNHDGKKYSWNHPDVGIVDYQQRCFKNTRFFYDLNTKDTKFTIPPEYLIEETLNLPTLDIVDDLEWKREQKNNTIYYKHKPSKTTQWVSPFNLKRTIKKKLIPNSFYYFLYGNLYLAHDGKPSNIALDLFNENEEITEDDFFTFLRSLIINNRRRGILSLHVNRKRILEDSLCLLQVNMYELRRQFKVVFIGEPSMDISGLTKEWIKLAAEELKTVLFVEDENKILTIDPKDYDPQLYQFLGVIIAQSLINNYNLGLRLQPLLIQRILGIPITEYDVLKHEPKTNLGWMIKYKNDENVGDLCLPMIFSVVSRSLENPETIIDVAFSSDPNEVVTKETISTYIQQAFLTLDRLYEPLQMTRMVLNSIIPIEWLKLIESETLSERLAGSTFNRDDFLNHIKVHLGNRVSRKDAEIVAARIKEYLIEQTDQQLLLLFETATGLKYPPFGGFKNLKPALHFQIEHGNNVALAHTCFNRIDIFIECPVPLHEQFSMLTNSLDFSIL